MTKEICKSVKPVGTRPGIMYGNCKVNKQQVDGCPPFRPILSTFYGLLHETLLSF